MRAVNRKKRKNKRRKKIRLMLGILSVVTLILFAALIYHKMTKNLPADENELSAESESLPDDNFMCGSDFSCNQEGRMQYCGSDSDIGSISGIDVSEFQGYIDWKKVAEDGIRFAYIRIGLRGSETGKIVPDTLAIENLQGAEENGIRTGVYFYSQAINAQEAIEEAQYTLHMIQQYTVTECVAIDIEKSLSPDSRTHNLESADYTEIVNAFSKAVSDAGYRPMVYGNRNTYFLMLDCAGLCKNLTYWYAYHSEDMTSYINFDIWQYAANGHVDGIDGEVDLDVMICENQSLSENSGGSSENGNDS